VIPGKGKGNARVPGLLSVASAAVRLVNRKNAKAVLLSVPFWPVGTTGVCPISAPRRWLNPLSLKEL